MELEFNLKSFGKSAKKFISIGLTMMLVLTSLTLPLSVSAKDISVTPDSLVTDGNVTGGDVFKSDINVGETKNIEIMAYNITYLAFTPKVSGVYRFYSSSSSDTYGYLFDADKNQLTYNDDSVNNNNFSITYELQGGVTYYWGARYYNQDFSGSFDVTLVCDQVYCDHFNTTSHNGKEATCTEDGYTAGVYCNDCETWAEGHGIINATGHTDENNDGVCNICESDIPLYQGTCGDNLNWYLYKNGLLEITGIGNMSNYNWGSAPWYSYRSNIISLVVGDGVTSIGEYAFSSCDSLISITIPDSVTSIGNYAFAWCESLTKVTIPDSVTSIGECAFGSCNNLKSVIIGNSVTSIGKDAFWFCSNLTSVTIPDSVTSIGKYAFYDCNNLINLTMPVSASIGEYSFYGCTSIEKVTLTKGNGTMNNYTSSTYHYTPWHSSGCSVVIIEDGVTSIGDFAFYLCESLTSITIPDSVTSIGYDAFAWCTSLTSIAVDENNSNYSNDEHGVLFDKDKTTLIQYPIGNTRTSYTIPDSVTSIGNYAFVDCDSLTSITIPDSVTSIGNYAFAWCESLTSITIPDSVTSIGDDAFSSCDSLTSITIPDSVTSIGDYAFSSCDSLTSITISDSVTSIGNYAFAWCESLTSITIPDSVTSIGNYAFVDCDSLTSITIPDSVTSIGNSAFSSCDSLTRVTIGNSVTSIGDSAFQYCSNLTSVTNPKSLILIKSYVFSNCSKLTHVLYTGTREEWNEVTILEGNNYFSKATRHYNATGDEVIYIDQVSCTEDGYSGRMKCTVCDTVIRNGTFVSALGHDNHLTEKLDPTCTTDGYEKYSSCSRCGDEITTVLTALGHDNHLTEKLDPTCTTDGYKKYSSCSRCGDEITTVLPALGHNHQLEGTIGVTCTTDGKGIYQCSRCDEYKITTIAAKGHSYYQTSYQEPTCTEDGYRIYHCSNCGDYITNTISAYGHNYKFDGTVPATCTEEGYEVYKCTRCAGFDLITIPKLQHGANESCQYCGASGEIIVTNASSTIIDTEKKVISGLSENLTAESIMEFIAVSGDVTVLFSNDVIGTGTVITLSDKDGNELDSYTAVVFGDYNGDGVADSEDTAYFASIANFEIFDYYDYEYLFLAADINGDGVVDSMDEEDMYAIANFEAYIDHTITSGSKVVRY